MVLRYVATEFGQSSSAAERIICVGEETCEKYISARGKTRAEKERSVCHQCPAFPTKINKQKYDYLDSKLELTVKQAVYARKTRQSGYPLDDRFLGVYAFEALLMLDDCFERFDRAERVRTNHYLKSLFKE